MKNNKQPGKVTPDVRKAINDLILYLWNEEKRHFDESDVPRNHIFRKIVTIDNWLNGKKCDSEHYVGGK